jgi:hypothetical protein
MGTLPPLAVKWDTMYRASMYLNGPPSMPFERLGIHVDIGPIDAIQLPAHSFDVITMWHFLEHVPDLHLVLG